MANPFLNKTELVDRDIETALLLEKANVLDIGKAVAYTDGDRVFVNTEDNLFNILPAYDQRMLKWLLWHEKMHLELRHHNRFFKYLKELDEKDTMDEFQITKDEVNIIMDILVHDSMAKMFPELVETAITNLAQMRNRNSLGYTFKTHTLEEMLKEYADYKNPEDKEKDSKDGEGDGEGEGEETDDKEGESKKKTKEDKDAPKDEGDKREGSKKGHTEGSDGHSEDDEEKPEDRPPEVKDGEAPPEPEHDKTDWSKLDDIDSKEFITKDEGDEYEEIIQELRAKKFRLAKLTETLNGLVTSTRKRSYTMPSTVHVGSGVMLKGSTPRTYSTTPML